jgi:hypothetical protein
MEQHSATVMFGVVQVATALLSALGKKLHEESKDGGRQQGAHLTVNYFNCTIIVTK